MHSYETLVLLALALSTAFPALSAPVRENQYQARADIDDSAVTSGLGDFFKSALKTVGISGGLAAATAAGEHFLDGGNSTRRAVSRDTDLTPAVLRFDGFPVGTPNLDNDLEQREPAGLGGVLDDVVSSSTLENLGKGALGGVAGALGTFGVDKIFNHTRREPSPLSGAGLGKTLAGLAASLAASDGIKDLLNHTRREPEPSPSNLIGDALTLEQLIQPFIRRLAELD